VYPRVRIEDIKISIYRGKQANEKAFNVEGEEGMKIVDEK
jgi:hypothetical protein